MKTHHQRIYNKLKEPSEPDPFSFTIYITFLFMLLQRGRHPVHQGLNDQCTRCHNQ